MNKVFSFVQTLVPKINAGMVITNFAACRAVDTTNDFVINEKEGFINVAGIQSPGLTASPAIGKMVLKFLLDIFKDAQPNTEWRIHPLHKKFNSVSTQEQAELADKDANHTKIICSCEMVTEADAQNAITDGARTLDGVKVRTRAGMGRCQGGFCSTRLVEILSERTGEPESAITKRGGDTQLSVGKIGGNLIVCKDEHCSNVKEVTEYKPVPIAESRPVILSQNVNFRDIIAELKADVVIVGAGPAGLGAGLSAAKHDP